MDKIRSTIIPSLISDTPIPSRIPNICDFLPYTDHFWSSSPMVLKRGTADPQVFTSMYCHVFPWEVPTSTWSSALHESSNHFRVSIPKMVGLWKKNYKNGWLGGTPMNLETPQLGFCPYPNFWPFQWKNLGWNFHPASEQTRGHSNLKTRNRYFHIFSI